MLVVAFPFGFVAICFLFFLSAAKLLELLILFASCYDFNC